jgi:subtilase family serine protease/flagellar hook assembly protein FlgD/fibronectin type 3 domain-containing protein
VAYCLCCLPAVADSLSARSPAAAERLRQLERGVQALPDTGSGITRDVGSIAVIEHDGSNYDMKTPDGHPNYAARAPVARRFYQSHGDNYDFLIIFTNFPFDTADAQAFHNLVRNDVRGIGRPVADNGALFGSPGRLKGYIDMADLDRWRQPGGDYSLRPGEPGFLATLNVLAHELAHQWLADALYRDPSGRVSSDLLGKDGGHWSYLLDSDASVMYGSEWTPRGDGRYVASRTSAAYSSLDLYLMGLLDPGRLPPFTLLRNAAIDRTLTPVLDAEVEAVPETITVGQLVAAMGPRVPDHQASTKEFRLGFIFLTRPGVEPDAEDLAAVEVVRQYFAAHFFALTRGVAVGDTSLAEKGAGEAAPVPDLARALSWLLAQQTPEGSWRDSPPTAVRDTAAVLEALAVTGQIGDGYRQGVAWLGGVDPPPVDFKVRRATALAATATAAERAGLLQAVLGARAPDGGFGFAPGFASDALDTALGLRALGRLKQPAGGTLPRSLATLAAQQLPSGGWPMVAGGEPSAIVTAEVLLALQDWAALPEAQALLAPGLAALLARRNSDGGFGESPSTPYATALALQVLLRASAPADVVEGAIAWLQARQLHDGSWASSRYETALVIASLRGGVAPNLVLPMDDLTIEPETVKEGVVVRVRARVRNVGRQPSLATHVRLYDGAPGAGVAVADVPVSALGAGADALLDFELPTAGRAGDRTIYAVVDPDGLVPEAREDDNTAARALRVSGRLPDLVVAAGDLVAVPYPPEDGEVVELSVRVANQGEKAAPASRVRLVRGNPRAGGVTLGEVTVPSLSVGEVVTVALAWDTGGQLGSHVIHALVDPTFSVFEASETNNETTLPVPVTGPPPPGADLEVPVVTLVPTVLQTLPAAVEVRAVLRNLGRDPADSSVALFEDLDPSSAEERPVTLGPRSSTTVTFRRTVGSPGSRSFTLRADPAGTLAEADESNNDRTAVLVDPQNTVDLELRPEEVSTAPEPIVIGQDLVVNATVRNRGTSSVIEMPVVLRHGSGGELARGAVTLLPGASTPVTFTWTTTVVGDAVPLVVVVDPFGLLSEVSEDNNRVDLAVHILPSTLANLQTTGPDIGFSPDPPREGHSATVSALVRNTSAVAVGPFTTRFYRGDPTGDGTPIGEVAHGDLGALASATVAVTWAPVDARGAQGVFVVVDPQDEIPEYAENDNRAFRSFSVLALPDLALTPGQVVLDPPYPRAGETVSITATVRNFGQQVAAEARLRVWSGEQGSGSEIAHAVLPAVPPGGSVVAALSWTPAGPPGEQVLSLFVDADQAVPETDEGNNRARLLALVQEADLFLTDAHLSPDGDGVRDHTTLGYRVPGPVTVVVISRTGERVRTLARDAPPSGSLSWDGTDDLGRVLPDGVYTILLEGAEGVPFGRLRAFLDTNRESIHDAAGTGLVGTSNLSCALPDHAEGPAFLPGEDEALFIVGFRFGEDGFPTGLLRVGLDGQYDFVSRDEWFQGGVSFASARAVSPDGREVLVRKDEELFAVDLLTGGRRPIAGRGHVEALWSPDGRWISTTTHILTREGTVVASLPSGTHLSRAAWSPDSRWVASANVLVSRDGAVVRTIPGMTGGKGATVAFETVWRGDGKIVSYVGLDCGDGCPSAGVFVIDPQTDKAIELPWLRQSHSSDSIRVPLGWSADGARLLHALYRDGDRGSFVAAEDGASPVQLLPHSVQLSPRSAVATYVAPPAPAAGCLGSSDVYAAFSLQNLTVGLRPARLPANHGILVSATASDRYLRHYQLEYASADEPDAWRPIGAALQAPVLDDVLTVWVPPAPGTYLLRVRAEDRAGNVRARTRTVAWDRVPLLANITQSGTLISPNGDGTTDEVTFEYLVIEPTTAEVRIVGPRGPDASEASSPLVRRFRVEHLAVGPGSFAWDGRDETGTVVPDGRYTVFLNDLPFRVTVDATPPDIAWSYERLRVEEGSLVADRVARVVDPGLADWSVPSWFGGREQIYEPLRDENGEVVYVNGVPAMLLAGGAAVSTRLRVPERRTAPAENELYNLATDPGAVLSAVDRAGNRSTLGILPVEERLLLLAAADTGGPLADSAVYRLPPHATFTLAETIRGTPTGGEPVRFRYQRREGGAWTEVGPFAVDREAAWRADFAALGLTLGREYRGQFTVHARGRDFSTQEFLFRPCTEAFELDLDARDLGRQRTVWALTMSADAPERLVSATLTVTGVGKLGGYRTVAPFVLGEENGVVTPTPSCATDPPGMLVFEVKVTGASGRVYQDDGHCRRLRRHSDLCSSLQIEQAFEYCAGSPEVLPLRVKATSIAAAATATIVRGPGDPPKPLAELTVPFTPVFPYERLVRDDVVGVPDGTTPITGSLVSSEGQAMAEARLPAIVDRSVPAVEVVEPPEGGLLCVSSDSATGLDVARLFFEVEDSGPDAEFAFAEVEHLSGVMAGVRAQMQTVCPPLPANTVPGYPPQCGNIGPEPAFPRVLTGVRAHLGWNVTGLPAGDYAVSATFCDRAGNRSSARRRLSLVRQAPGPSLIGVVSEVFSPNGDGGADEATIKIRMPQAAELTVEVEAVRTLVREVTVPAGERTFTWDGRREDGSIAPDGVYQVLVKSRDGCGRGATLTARVVLDNTPPVVAIAAPTPGQLIGVAADVRGVADDPYLQAWELRFGAGESPTEWAVVGDQAAVVRAVPVSVPPGLLARWDTPPVPGTYTIRLVGHDRALNRAESQVVVEVRPRVQLGRLSATPDHFSPNGDGRRESTSIGYEVLGNARVTLDVTTADPTAARVRLLEPAVERLPGPYIVVWDGAADGGTPAADGEYRVHIRVEDPSGAASPQEESIPVVLDRSPPAIVVESPAPGGFATRDGTVRGTITDPNLSRYVVSAFPTTGGDPVELAEGTRPAAGGNLGPLARLGDGRHTLFVRAEDAAENRATVDVPFVVDSLPPTVAIARPVAGAVLDTRGPPFPVVGTAADENLASHALSVGPGAQPAYFTPIAAGETGGVGIALGSWALAGIPDGPYTLRLDASDRAGLRGRIEHAVILDGTPPEARIDVPGEGAYVREPGIVGTASDATLEAWTLESVPGPATAAQWSPLEAGTQAIAGGPLALWEPMPPDGLHTLRLTVRDRAGHVASVLRTVTVDRTAPAVPTGLAAVVERTLAATAEVRLTWNPNQEPDLAGYRFHRGDVDAPLALLGAPLFLDADRPDGVYRYAVEAVDRAGNVSGRATLETRVDLTPPLADILRPLEASNLSGEVEIHGTAYSADDFREYRLYVGPSQDPASWTLLRRSTLAVSAGPLGYWTALGSGGHIFVLEAEDLAGNVSRATRAVAVDNEVPAPPVLTSLTNAPAATALTVTWTPSPSPDVSGYLVYRDGRVANAPALALDSLRGFLVPAPTYVDRELADGEHCYRVVALDAADNASAPSNERCRALDNAPPRAQILDPPSDTRFDYPLHIVAFTLDLDVASIRFQYRAEGEPDWRDLGAADTRAPFETTLDPAPLPRGRYQLRAVATDNGGRTDGDPPHVSVIHGDATAPRRPDGLRARTDGADVSLSWIAVVEASGYHVFRDQERITAEASTPPAFVDVGLEIGLHRYEVAAVDADGNQSARSDPAHALVYKLTLDPPGFPVTTATDADLAGSGAAIGTTVEVLSGEDVVGQTTADSETFVVEAVTLAAGPNLLRGRARDADGNRSLPSDEVVVIANAPPPAVENLRATVTGPDVDLTWDPVADPELHGYVVQRGETALTASSPHTSAASVQASHLWIDPSTGDYRAAEHAFDGDRASAWVAPPGAVSPEWRVVLPTPVAVDRLTLEFATVAGGRVVPASVASYRLEAGWQGRFVPLATARNNAATRIEHVLPAPFATDVLRVVLLASGGQPGIAELEVSKVDVVPAGTTARHDVPRDGVFAYGVAAMDRYGARGQAATVDAAVGDVVAPARPSGLVATVEGSDVVLTWSANPEPDVTHYIVARDGARVATAPEPTYRDVRRPNGSYEYRVIAVDQAGNESPESAPAAATTAVAPPGAPTLQGMVGALGQVLLAWAHPGAPDFVVHRSLVGGGPYAPLARSGGLQVHEDRTAAFGVTHYYVVCALDASGNLSPLSNEVALMPVRTAPLPAPEIQFPTHAARPIVLPALRSPVQGRAPAGSLVTLDVNDTLAAVTETRAAWVERDAVPMPGTGAVVSRNGRTVAYQTFGSMGGEVYAVDLPSGRVRQAQQTGYAETFHAALSPDGRSLAFVAIDGTQVPNRSDLFVMDLESGAVVAVEDGEPFHLEAAAWSRDGTRLAYLTATSTVPSTTALSVRDLTAGVTSVVLTHDDYASIQSVAWAPDGGRVAFSRAGPSVWIADLATGAETWVAEGADPAWSADGRQLAYSRTVSAGSQVFLRDLEHGTERPVTDGRRPASQPAFDATGARLAYLEWEEVAEDDIRPFAVVHELGTGRRLPVEPHPDRGHALAAEPIRWLEDGRLALSFDWEGRLALFEPEEGHFDIPEVTLRPGENVLVARALDVASDTVSADSDPVRVTVPPELAPDLAVDPGEVAFYPAVPVKGEVVIVSAVVRERTERGAGDVRVEITIVDSSGMPVLTQVATLAAIQPQGAATASVSWVPPREGTHRVRVRVDPELAIDELREDNNEVVLALEVVPGRGLATRVVADRDRYAARSAVRIEVDLVNGGTPVEGRARLTVEDVSGRVVAVVDTRPVFLAYGAETRFTVGWNTASTYAGDYVCRLRVDDARDVTVGTAQWPFRILPDLSMAANLRVDRALVREGGPASFAAGIENRGINTALTDLVGRLRIVAEGAADVSFEAEAPLGLLLPGALWQGRFTWPSAAPGGAYRATLDVLRANVSLARSEVTFAVDSSAPSLSGTLALDQADVFQDSRLEARLTISNRGVSSAMGLPVAVELRGASGATLFARETLVLDLSAGETRVAAVSLTAPAPGAYLVFLRVGIPATTLSRVTLRVHGPITRPAIDSPADGARVPSPHPMLRVSNAVSPEGAGLSYDFQLFADPSLQISLPGQAGVAETPGWTGWRVPSNLTEDATYWWRARATDGFSSSAWTEVSSFVVDARNEPPAAPAPDRPEPGERVATREPTLVVTNALDPELDALTYELRLAADPDLVTVVASASGVGQGAAFTQWQVPATLEEDTRYYWTARAFDGTSHSPWSAPVSFIVDTLDGSPTAPVPVHPRDGLHVRLRSPALTVRNAVDPEGWPLTYRFEIDQVATFDSPDLQVSADLGESALETSWTPPAPLRDDTAYWWRAAASDQATLGPWAGADFFVNVSNDPPGAPVPLEPADFQVIMTATPALRVRNAVDPERDAITYEFEVADGAGFVWAAESGVPEGALATAWTVPRPLPENHLLVWRARAKDSEIEGPWSASWHFRVNAVLEPPTAPGLVAPPDGAVIATAHVALTVSNATSPEGFGLAYAFELYRVDTAGGLVLVAAVDAIPEGPGSTSWTPLVDLADGTYAWRASAHDGRQPGPWMPTARLRVATDVPPSPPSGLAAVPGDREVALTWNASAEPDVRGYNVYRGETSGGPYALVAAVATPALIDRERTNGVTVHYVVTATDARHESAYSAEVAATPRAQVLVADIRYRPHAVAGECLVIRDDDDDHHDDDDRDDDDDERTRLSAEDRAHGDDHDDDDHDDDDGGGGPGRERCPRWIYAAIELPGGRHPSSIERATVRLAGAAPPDSGYGPIVDLDGDGVPERDLRFRFAQVAPRLDVGPNDLSLSGRAGAAPFQGTGRVTVSELNVDLRFTPRTLKKRGSQPVQAVVSFRDGVRARQVDEASIRLNGAVPIARVLTAQDTRLTVKFDRDVVAAALPAGDHVQIWLSGTIRKVPFVARDVIRVID